MSMKEGWLSQMTLLQG